MSFGYEQYLDMKLSYNEAKKLAKFRSSSHQFNIETGRHGTYKRNQVVPRICNACSTDERDVLKCPSLRYPDNLPRDNLPRDNLPRDNLPRDDSPRVILCL